MEFKLNAEFIALDNLLKALQLAESGGQAKQQILEGLVKVNGEVELRIRRKLRLGDAVEFAGNQITLVA